MNKIKYKYIYGPVSSWRLGSSLGVDLLSKNDKICTFDCIYCQLGKTKIFSGKREVFVPVKSVIDELNLLPSLHIDYITFSGRGEPTLAKNIGEAIKEVKKIRDEKVAVLTNSSLVHRDDVRKDLLSADFVVAKLDASTGKIFNIVDRPDSTANFDMIIKGIKEFKRIYKGKLALQIMFLRENKEYAKDIAQIARKISPDEVQINTPLRPCGALPLVREDINTIKSYFKGLNVVSVYEAEKKKVEPVSEEDTLIRRGKI